MTTTSTKSWPLIPAETAHPQKSDNSSGTRFVVHPSGWMRKLLQRYVARRAHRELSTRPFSYHVSDSDGLVECVVHLDCKDIYKEESRAGYRSGIRLKQPEKQ